MHQRAARRPLRRCRDAETSILASIINALVPLTPLFFITIVFRDEWITRAQLLGAATLLPMFLIDGLNHHDLSSKAVFGILALGIFGSGLAFMWNFRSIELLGSSMASTVTYRSSVVATIVAVTFLREHLTWFRSVGR